MPVDKSDTPTQGPGLADAADRMAALMTEAPEKDTPDEAPDEDAEAKAEDAEALEAEDDTEDGDEGDEDADDDGDDEATANDEEDEGDDTDEPELYTVKIDGKEEQVSLDEALKGYQRQADYTRKTQSLSTKEKEVDAKAEQLDEQLSQYAELLPRLQEQVDAALDEEPDWKALEREDPYEYLRQKEAWRELQEKQQVIKAERQRVQQEAERKRQEQIAAWAKQERDKLLKVAPEWKDEKKFKSEISALREYGLKQGFSDEQLAGMIDHRLVLMMRKAKRYDDMVTTKPRRGQRKGPKVAKAGAGTNSPTTAKRVSQQKKRLQKTGSLHDAASLFERIL